MGNARAEAMAESGNPIPADVDQIIQNAQPDAAAPQTQEAPPLAEPEA